MAIESHQEILSSEKHDQTGTERQLLQGSEELLGGKKPAWESK